MLEATHAPEEFYSYVMRTEPNGVHFPFPIWIQGYGGNVFRDPPNDLTPTLNTPEALAATDDFTGKIMRYSIAGSQIYGTPDCQNAMAQGLAGIWVDALGIFSPITNPETSKVADKVEIALPPGGPAGQFPQIATHGLQIPAGSQKKDAAWEFIAWATSHDFMFRAMEEVGYNAVNRQVDLDLARIRREVQQRREQYRPAGDRFACPVQRGLSGCARVPRSRSSHGPGDRRDHFQPEERAGGHGFVPGRLRADHDYGW